MLLGIGIGADLLVVAAGEKADPLRLLRVLARPVRQAGADWVAVRGEIRPVAGHQMLEGHLLRRQRTVVSLGQT